MATQLIPYSLRLNEAVCPGMVRILKAIGQSVREISEKPESELEKSIHDIRTLIKRLRAYLWFLRPAIGRALYAQRNATLRKAAQRLSKTRDLHAVASALTKTAIPSMDEKHLHALAQVSQAFAQQTAAAKKTGSSVSLLEKVSDPVIQVISNVTKIMKRNDREISSPGHRLKKAFKQARKAMKKTMHKKDSRLVHEWRKKTKRLFYILQLTDHLPNVGMIECLRKVDKLQEKLGDFQDNIVAENHLRACSPEVDSAHLEQAIHLLRKNRKILFKDAHHCWDAVLNET
jgi:CHAD domain-containing protein